MRIQLQMNRELRDRRESMVTISNKRQSKQSEFQWVAMFGGDFTKAIRHPIQLRQQLMKNNELQRCLQHNIIFSIYCTICRKILCASCMYSSLQHRKHRVIPIQNAAEEIKDDLRSFCLKTPRLVQQCDGLTNSNNDFFVRMQREFNPIIGRIQQFYENLRGFLKLKEKEQLKVLKQKRDLLRAQIAAYNSQLGKIQQYVTEKIKSYANTNLKPQLILPARNIIQNLLLANNFVKESQFETSTSRFHIDCEKFKVVLEEIIVRISSFIPEFESGFKDRNRYSARSLDQKQKSVCFTPQQPKKNADGLKWEKRRQGSSVAGANTLRRY